MPRTKGGNQTSGKMAAVADTVKNLGCWQWNTVKSYRTLSYESMAIHCNATEVVEHLTLYRNSAHFYLFVKTVCRKTNSCSIDPINIYMELVHEVINRVTHECPLRFSWIWSTTTLSSINSLSPDTLQISRETENIRRCHFPRLICTLMYIFCFTWNLKSFWIHCMWPSWHMQYLAMT